MEGWERGVWGVRGLRRVRWSVVPGGPAGAREALPDGFVNLLEHGARSPEDLLVREAKDREPEGSQIEVSVL